MSLDGSFRLEVAVERFLDRCPELKSIPRLENLLKKGSQVTEEEVVGAVAELVLIEKYTIPLIGCFRAISKKIVDRTVSRLLLESENLKSDNDDNYMEEDENVDKIIDVYFRQRKGLRLHELACLAFCRALDLVPSLLGSILNYFKVAPAPFERVRQCKSDKDALVKGVNQFLDGVRASYRLLILNPENFTTLWNWSCILDLVQLPLDPTIAKNEDISDLRWCSRHISSVVLKLSFKASANFGLQSEQEAFQCSLRWKEFCMDVSLEKANWYLESRAVESDSMVAQRAHFSSLSTSSSTSHEIIPSNSGTPFILTPTITKSFEMVSLALSEGRPRPVLLYGPAGAGKTALINTLAHIHGSKVLSVHMDDQIDGKTLIGSYVCTEQPGDFRWQPGSLTQAVVNGVWVVFEEIDKAPPDVLSILSPLLEGATKFSTGHGEVAVNESFRLFSTVTSSNPDISRSSEGRNSLGAVWVKVMMGPPSNQDLLSIVLARYPELKSHAQKLIETFETVNQLTRSQLGLTASSPGYHNRFTLRDLLKLCKRIASLGLFSGQDQLSNYTCDLICKEAMDVFATFSTKEENRLAIMREIAILWGCAAPEYLYPENKPIIQELKSEYQVGRARLKRLETTSNHNKKPFVPIRASAHALERIACSVMHNEPVLLVGETGTGKTTLVQTLATKLGQKLTVLNLSQQSDIADLLGGFKPVDARFVCTPLYQEFAILFTKTFSSKDNERFLTQLRIFLTNKNWKMLLTGFQKGVKKILETVEPSPGKKRKRPLSKNLLKDWGTFSEKLESAQALVNASGGMIFSFLEGAFITAMKNGEWILLDEVNLAPPEILQRVIGVLEDDKGSLCLAERGDIEYVSRAPNFRIFACMNPATDAGKRDLPVSLRGRFTEHFVDDKLDDEDLRLFINQFVDHDDKPCRELVGKIVTFYNKAKEDEKELYDGANQKPHYSLRSLYRALEYLKKAKNEFLLEKSVYDGFSMFFLNSLDDNSAKSMKKTICKHLLDKNTSPPSCLYGSYLKSNKAKSKMVDDESKSYVLTNSVEENLTKLAQAIFIKRYPVLLQGPTSSGKTSLVRYLATKTGHEFVRINNHEHTDLQEYLGSYITDATGKLVFHEGALVKAVRNGHWIVLDELNLAPSDVLEALNRLLDDNRELFVPELQETVRAHENFMLFATQNPPVVYGGRKVLSRAFRNRFVEIQVDEIPHGELSTILEKRCGIPPRCAKIMVDVMEDLQKERSRSKMFAGKHGFITPRDLFRWADRLKKFGNEGRLYEDLAYDGYYLMAERLRDDGEKKAVREALERQLSKNGKGRVKICDVDLYKQEAPVGDSAGKVIWTNSMLRMYFLVKQCYENREPVLLVGETGGGKTTVCQMLSSMLNRKLHVLNCHQYTETSDFIGGFYPVRDRSRLSTEFQNLCDELILSKAFMHFPGDDKFSTDINQASSTLNLIKKYKDSVVTHHPEVTVAELCYIEGKYLELSQLQKKWQSIFVWQDGPLVEAMKNGDLFLADEISLADDSVLERLNSVLEPERKLSLAEKGGSNLETLTADPDFFILATMNPGGDYGKKELSPALRNRFTEIWIPSVKAMDELKNIALARISNPQLSHIVDAMLKFWEWFNDLQKGRLLTIRDLLSWITFINIAEKSLSAESAFVHGAFLVLLDGLTLGTNILKTEAARFRTECLDFLLKKLKESKQCLDVSGLDRLESYGWTGPESLSDLSQVSDDMECDNLNLFGIDPFYIEKGTDETNADGFEFLAPTTRRNTMRLLRAMQLNKPVLLEGSPGVGKTSLITAVGRFSGHTVVRINLSEQTDIMDLLGSDLPVESDEGLKFDWSDGILLQALKKGSWVLLDELNLAPQSVLEGLNAILDHRAEVFIPELGRSFKCPNTFRVFACQNPCNQGGGRKGLPKSFLNRFTKVYVDELVDDDYLSICTSLYPSIEKSLLLNLITFNKKLHEETMLYHRFGQDGSPWEFNLRDVIRSCQIIETAPKISNSDCFLSSIYLHRMRTPSDRVQVIKLYEEIFRSKPFMNPYPKIHLSPRSLTVGNVSIERYLHQSSTFSSNNLKILPGLRHCLEAVTQCVKNQWLCILVGPPSSGKTSLIRLLAQLSGNILHELNLSSATDISELLGCFEQYNASRHYHHAVAQVGKYVNKYCNSQLESSPETNIHQKDLIGLWLKFVSNDNGFATHPDSVPQLVEIIERLKMDNDESCKDLDITLKRIKRLEKDFQKKEHSVKFEWVTGLLIKAIENGEWIVLENANLCNPTVLDRINSLVEESGSITINECGIMDGNPVVIHPHRNFRMFLTVNPSYGEVSRAMRNRGVEIYLMQPYWLTEEIHDDVEVREVKRFITLSGIPVGRLVDMMAQAHIYAIREGYRLLNVSVTYLELSRWVNLFRRLISDGNEPVWSIQISWEHTYLSSFGEGGKGKDIVSQGVVCYLSKSQLYEIASSEDLLLCLPGGWPSPLELRDYVCYSSETCVRENVMLLESLGSQIGSHLFSNVKTRLEGGNVNTIHHLIDAVSLQRHLVPSSKSSNYYGGQKGEFDKVLATKKLSFAADWVIEQATNCDYKLYIDWFEWFGTFQLQAFVPFFKQFSALLEVELKHSIWTRIFNSRTDQKYEIDPAAVPLLSVALVDDLSLINPIKCVSLLRRSLQQWRIEKDFFSTKRKEIEYRSHGFDFVSVLTCLRKVEEKVLDLLVESPEFDLLFKKYSELLDHHILFWNSVISSQIEESQLLISRRALMKDVAKLKEKCPELSQVIRNLECATSMHLKSSKSLLWTHGGHPILPSSNAINEKQSRLRELCDKIWPRKNKLMGLDGDEWDDNTVSGALFSNVELRDLAMNSVSKSSLIIGQSDPNDFENIQKLEEQYQILSRDLDTEKPKLRIKLGPTKLGSSLACCVFTPDILRTRSGFERWLKTQPIVDETSISLDLELLQNLTKIPLFDIEKQHEALKDLSGPLESSLNFSVKKSLRPPTDMISHYKILKTLENWELVPGANEKLRGFIMEMWFKWHATLWEICPVIAKTLADDDANKYGVMLPYKLFWPLKSAMVDQILQDSKAIRDYPLHRFKLRAASCNIFLSSANLINSRDMLLLAARSLFQQIIYAHKKSFGDSEFASIRSALNSIQELSNPLDENVKILVQLLGSSNHQIFTSLIGSYIEPLLSELYHITSSDYTHNLGCALLRIGGMRYNLLVCCDDLDPTLKYSVKFSELTEKITSLEIEIQVRRDCVYLAGSSHQKEADNYRINLLEKLNVEKTRLQKKMVFRSKSENFKELKRQCDQFLGEVRRFVDWIENVNSLPLEEVTKQVHGWQDSASRLIDRLSKYSTYADITEPVQVAIYEMKLGLSLILSNVLYKSAIGNHNMEFVLSTIYTFMRFPRICSPKIISVEVDVEKQPKLATSDIPIPTSIEQVDMDLLQNVLAQYTVSQTSSLPFKVPIYLNILARIKDSVGASRFLGDSSFNVIHKIFDDVSSLWMLHRSKPSEDSQALQFKSKARSFNIESILKIDISNFVHLLEDDEKVNHEDDENEDAKVNYEEDDDFAKEWNAQESNLDGIVIIHNQLFGSVDLVKQPGNIQVSDTDRLSSFLESYTLGVKMARDLKGLFSSAFDAKIGPEHLLRLCLEHDPKFTRGYNFYMDSNSPMMEKLVGPVVILKDQVIILLEEWDNTPAFPALQRIKEVADMVLDLPLDTPLAKALTAIELLLNRVRFVQENVGKFQLSQQLEPIFGLVSLWHKLEFESWPALLDEVQSKIEKNAAKLWFPLYSVLQRGHTAGNDLDKTKSLNEFFKTSCIGEFKSQLQLLLSLHGHISNGLNRGSYTSPSCQEENLKILYNTFGFYVQLLPRILEHIGANRRCVEKELNELLKLCRWDRIDNHFAIESLKKTRLKLRKIVRKYTDQLQQPLVEFLGQEANTQTIQGPKLRVEPYEVSKTLLDTVYNQTQSDDKDSPLYLEERKQLLLHTIEELCVSLIHCGDLWEDNNKKLGKRRAFSELLKLLESCGLSKHRLSKHRISSENCLVKSQSWLLEPSYEVQHLLLTQQSDSSSKKANTVDFSREIIWKTANKFYFKSINSIDVLGEIRLNFHKDFSLQQVERSESYVDHLIEIQQEQRAVAYNFAMKLKCLRQCIWPLSNLSSSSVSDESSIKNQLATFKCMWQQKQLFDNFCTVLYEDNLLLQTVQKNHLNKCSSVKDGVDKISSYLQRFLPYFQESKNSLDCHLLGSNEDITMVRIALHPYGVTKEMEQLVNKNFELIKTFEKDVSDLRGHDCSKEVVQHILLGHFEELFEKAHTAEEFYASLHLNHVNSKDTINELELNFKGKYKDILSAFQRLGSLNTNDFALSEESSKNIKEWKNLFEKDTQHLQLDIICEDVMRTIQYAGELLNYYRVENPSMSSSVFVQLEHMYVLLDKILAFGDNLLQDFLVTHSMVSTVTYALANIFASLFSKGFGTTEEQDNESTEEGTQDARGTGMGDGAGLNDVSDQITDEDQLLGASEKANEEERDAKSEIPDKNEKGIEMEQDFDADALSVSEGSEDDENEDNNDDEDEPTIDSAMGEVGADSDNIVDEKLGDKDDEKDDQKNGENEKYETGSSLKDKSSQEDELRAKEDSMAAADKDDENHDGNESANENDENGKEGSDDGPEDMGVDKDDAFLEPTGINPEDANMNPEQDAPMDEPMEDGEPEGVDDPDAMNIEENTDLMDEEAEENTGATDGEPSLPESDVPETDIKTENHDFVQNTPTDNTPQSGQSIEDDHSNTSEMKDASTDKFENDLAPTAGAPNASDLEIKVADSANGERLTNEQSRTSLPPPESLTQKLQPNPSRSIGDALDGWKDSVKVSVDLKDEKVNPDDMVDENAAEYGYTAEFKEGTAQALGPATAEQIKGDINQNDNEKDTGNTARKESDVEMEIEKSASDIINSYLNPVNDAKKQNEILDLEKQFGELSEIDGGDYNPDLRNRLYESSVSVNRSYMSEDTSKFSKFSIDDKDDDKLGKARAVDPCTDMMRDDASLLWRKYESNTTRLSQELAQQLRLVMEPTLASRLRGDYKTGKRINMRQVIPYIASHYRKDRIWLRRTRPDKRDYQVVVAVDDSRSMSEGQCGNFAMEALVTVCRAMSQAEVGNLAVASFGQQGNIRLLHDFDQTFTPEAGIEMLSNLTFKQENTIVGEPMADLLKYLNNMLDDAVVHARQPSGFNPLQQLVLIIGDGRFNEKEKLRSYVRDALSKKRMVAFLILDSPNESILDLQEWLPSSVEFKLSNYLDTFPFPYYVVLKDIEALPRTLADLLRQWFELMQNSRE